MAYIVAGPFVALVGIVAVFFVLRRKSVEKRSMYSARRSQIEHKVRAARQRTLTPHGRAEKAPEPEAAAAAPFAPTQVQPTVTYQRSAFEAPPAAPPARPRMTPEPPPWEQGPTPMPAAPGAPDYPIAQPEPFAPAPVEPFRPAPEPTPMPASEPSWTPAPGPAAPTPPAEPMAPAASATASATAAGAWSIVSPEKETSAGGDARSKKKDKGGPTGAWQLASGDSPGMESDEPEARRSNAKVVAIAQYAIFVVGLVMVLIGIVVMVANSRVT
jgi:translation initiation factor IF-2